MPNNTDNIANGTPRASHLSPISPSSTLTPTWHPPRAPLPPHRLAKLANALGVSTPVPANHGSSSTYLSRSYSDSASPVEQLRRSPTPSSAMGSSMSFNSHSQGPSTSKFLLHVIPPIHLPHDSENPDDVDNLPPPNAPGYHTQFRRGTLVQVHSTLQAQLGAIAKEYALPSSAGLILYLVTSSTTPQSPSPQDFGGMDEPGPRLSEDIWKHLWTRVVRTEQRDDGLLSSRSQTPVTPHTPRSPFMLGMGAAARSTPFLPQEHANINSASSYLRPTLSTSPADSPLAPQPTYPIPTAPSTPSSVSASDRRSNNKSAPPSSAASQSEPGSPDTSVDDSGLRAGEFLNLPGLASPALIPILAKVEFDIDRRRAAWYEPWVRSRKANHAKRAESRKGSRSRNVMDGDEGKEQQQPREAAPQHVPIELLTGKKDRTDPFASFSVPADKVEVQKEEEEQEEVKGQKEEGVIVQQDYVHLDDGEGGYAPLSESPVEVFSEEEDGGSDSDTEDFGEDATARVSATLTASKDQDPLDDVFGTDADTWADIHTENVVPISEANESNVNPNIVELALTAEEVSNLPDPKDLEDDADAKSAREEEEVFEMLEMMGRPQLGITIPLPLPATRKIPPPLVLKPKDKARMTLAATAEAMQAPMTADNTRLAYDSPENTGSELNASERDADEFDEYKTRVRSPEESDKRGGAVFDDLDLGLEPTEDFDDNDPNDRRRSQYLMSAQLDEIERTLASLSPRFMTTELGEEHLSFNSATLSPSTPANMTLSPARSFDFLPPPSPRLPQHPEPPENEMFFAGQSWPAVPFSSINSDAMGNNPNAPPSPPRLAVNGVTTSAPRSYMPATRTPSTGPSESERRKKLGEEEDGLYPPPTPSRATLDTPEESPIIPLSPDPFGRHPSTLEPPNNVQMSGAQWDTMTIGKGGQTVQDVMPVPAVQGRARSNTTSRFSTDSLRGDGDATVVISSKSSNRTTLISVKSIKNLWRKSNKSDKAANGLNGGAPAQAPVMPRPPTPTATTSGRSSPMVPQRPDRPSEDQLYLPDIPEMRPPANMGRLSPMPTNLPPSPYLPIQEQIRPNSRTSLEQHNRPSLDQQNMPPQHPSVSNGRLSPMTPSMIPPSPQIPTQDQLYPGQRPSLDQQNRGPPPQPLMQSLNNGRLSPQSSLAPQPLAHASSDPMYSGARTSQGHMYPQVQGHMSRPSQDQHIMPPMRPSLDQLSPPAQPQQFQQQLNIPTYAGRNPNPGPIITPYMQAAKSASSLDRLHFDQESPYPSTRRAAPVRQSPRPPSPPPLPAIPEQEKTAGRKSILRWKSAASSTSTSSSQSIASSEPQPRSSFERPNSSASSRGRRPSVINFGSTRTSVTSPDLPPSPPIPNQYSKHSGGLDHRTSQRSRLTASSIDSSYSPPQRQASLGARSSSPPRSLASSRDSQGSRPSFDASQFEFVSPKTGSLTYPYNSLDHQP